MLGSVLAVASLSLSLNAPAWAEPKSWNVTEEGTSGIQYAQGAWDLLAFKHFLTLAEELLRAG